MSTPGPSRRGDTPALGPALALRQAAVFVALGVLLAALTWPAVDLFPEAGIDQSWQAALAMGFHQGLGFGSRLAFAYGPLGFLTTPAVYFPGPAVAAGIWMAVLRVSLFSTLVWSFRRSFGWPAAVALSWVAGVTVLLVVTPEPLLGVVAVWCLALARGEVPARGQAAAAGALGAVAGLGLLVKFSVGVAALVLAVVAALAAPSPAPAPALAPAPASASWRRQRGGRLGVLLGALVVVTLAGWLATGNALGDLATWLSQSIQVTLGYSSAMGLEVASLSGDYWRAPVVAAVVVGLAALETWRRRPGARRFGVVLVAVLVLAAVFKEGFVRHNLHSLIYFGVGAMALAGLRARGRRDALVLAGGVVVVALLAFDTAGFVPRTSLDPVGGLEALGHQAAVLASPPAMARTMASARAAMRPGYGLDPATLALVEGQTVWVEPWEESLVWAYPSLGFDPPPLFQTYVAYTPSLDRADASFLSSSLAPARILRQPGLALDGRDPALSPPATQLAILCHYAAVRVTPSWEVLDRVAPRCRAPRSLGRVATGWGRWVTVPAAGPGQAVVARFGPLPLPASTRLAALVLRPPVVDLQVRPLPGPGSGAVHTYRFVPGTAEDTQVLSAPGQAGAIGALRLVGGGLGSTTSGLSISFSAVPVPGG